MAKSAQYNGTIRLLVYVGVILLGIAAVWGAVKLQVGVTADDVKAIKEIDLPKKLDKEVFQMYLDQEQIANDKSDAQRNRIEVKLDKALEK